MVPIKVVHVFSIFQQHRHNPEYQGNICHHVHHLQCIAMVDMQVGGPGTVTMVRKDAVGTIPITIPITIHITIPTISIILIDTQVDGPGTASMWWEKML